MTDSPVPRRQCCPHLASLAEALRGAGVATQHEGPSWWGGSRGVWLYFDCTLEQVRLRARFGLPDFVEWHEYDGRVAGQEAGFVCTRCESAVMGAHPNYRGSSYLPFG